jgi:hypothetical protein
VLLSFATYISIFMSQCTWQQLFSNYYYYYYYYYNPRYPLYAGYLHLYSWNKPCHSGTLCCNYSDVKLFMVRISLIPALTPLYLYVSTFRSMCAVPNMAVFCSSLTSWFRGTLLMYFLNDFEMVPVAPIITGIIFVFTFHMRCIFIVRSLYIRIFSASFLILLLLLLLLLFRRYFISKNLPGVQKWTD